MNEMTSVERITNILARQPVDRIGLFEHFWGDTRKKWATEGHLAETENLADHFGFDIQGCGGFQMVGDIDFKPEVLEETEKTILKRDGNGAVLRTHKLHNATPEHVDFAVKEQTAWEELIKRKLTPDRRRINFEGYRNGRRSAADNQRFACMTGAHAFELMKNVCGHEYMLMGMATDPEWIKDMVMTYSTLYVSLMEILFEEEGLPDGIWFYEDMGFKHHPFMSPDAYREIMLPGHKLTVDFAHSKGLPVIMHSCGFVEPLVPGMIDAGVDCLQVIEVKAGMDLLQLKADYGDHLSFCGGMDARNLVANDREAISAELLEKIPVVMKDSGYILHSDHSIPDQCEYETYRYFVDEGLRLGTYV